MQINAAALKALRERTGLSVTELADQTSIKRSHLSNLEAGRRSASEATIVDLAKVLKVPVTAIICDPVDA